MQKIKWIFIAIMTTVSCSKPGVAMSGSNPMRSCTFSEMHIAIQLDGKPANGAKVTRTVDWRKEIVDEFNADENGEVTLPAQFETSFTKFLPMEFVSSQYITVEFDDKEYVIWNYAKREAALNSEMNGKPLKLVCELSNEAKTQRAFGSILSTPCTWANED
ncbi:DUF6795 domain-containing protein [Microbulbifer sp. SA54]|uniref:DUF6795 domain-containing protein n=1 Tax=Microbulbifer sp. SA54 TaxID=3401577 RepID=UPI003AAD9352